MASIIPQTVVDNPNNGVEKPAATPKPSNWVPLMEQPLYSRRKLRIVCVGAGYSGLMIAYKWKHEMAADSLIDLTIYEKNSDVGGTWLENRYPGVACDVPAHICTFTFEPNPDWSSFYASGPEIWDYIKRTTKKYNLDERVQLNSKVVSSIWDDVKGKWKLEIEQNGTILRDEADVLINGSGILNKWRWPDIQGLGSFTGTKLHSAAWDPTVDWTDKRVAIIGNGSSAIQILPKMQPKAARIVNYIRSPTWISANFASAVTPDGKNFQYTEDQKRELRENPEKLLELRKLIEHHINKIFHSCVVGTPEQLGAEKALRATMQSRLNNDPELCAKLIPEWKVGCRRLTPGDGYLEALQAPNVVIEFGSTPNMPNYFIFNGPNCPVGHGSLMAVIEWVADYIFRWCMKIATEDIKSMTVDEGATANYNTYSQEVLTRTVWASGCRSWYKNNKVQGQVTAMHAGSILHLKEILESFRTEDFHFDYWSRNRFRFMGNGMTARDERREDLAYYLSK